MNLIFESHGGRRYTLEVYLLVWTEPLIRFRSVLTFRKSYTQRAFKLQQSLEPTGIMWVGNETAGGRSRDTVVCNKSSR